MKVEQLLKALASMPGDKQMPIKLNVNGIWKYIKSVEIVRDNNGNKYVRLS